MLLDKIYFPFLVKYQMISFVSCKSIVCYVDCLTGFLRDMSVIREKYRNILKFEIHILCLRDDLENDFEIPPEVEICIDEDRVNFLLMYLLFDWFKCQS